MPGTEPLSGLALANPATPPDSPQRSPQRWRFQPEFTLGGQGSHGGEHWVTGGTAGLGMEVARGDSAFGHLRLRGSYDHGEESIDDDRHALWYEGRLLLGALPWAPGADDSLRLGLRTDLSFVENTPTSIEREVLLLGGPALCTGTDRLHLDGLVGWYAGRFELDDDLPRLRGFDRDALESDRHGFAAAATLAITPARGWVISFTGRTLFDDGWLLRETVVGVAVDAPLLFAGVSPQDAFVRLSADERFFDPDIRAALPYIRDGWIRLELVFPFGQRSRRSYGY